MTEINSAYYRLNKALKELRKVAHKDSSGYGYEYMSLPALLEKAENALIEQNFAFFQNLKLSSSCENSIKTVIVDLTTDKVILDSTVLLHDLEKEPKTFNKEGKDITNFSQNFGTSVTYYRRYALFTILNIQPDKDTDGVPESPYKKSYSSASPSSPKQKTMFKRPI